MYKTREDPGPTIETDVYYLKLSVQGYYWLFKSIFASRLYNVPIMIEEERGDGQKCRHTRSKRVAPNSQGVKHLRGKKRSLGTAAASGHGVDSNHEGGVVRVGVTYVTAAAHMDQHQARRQTRSA